MTNQEIIAVIQAYEEGKTIQYENGITGEWFSVKTPEWNFQKWRYRVKPEPEPPKYEPFSFEDDLVGMVVVRDNQKHIVTNQKRDYILVSGYSWIDYEGFLKNYTFTDGKPCGKLVQQ